MNYRHAFHAGNFADVIKHLALIGVLRHLRKKNAPFAVIDTHAGRGAYDLAGPEAVRTGEAKEGIGCLQRAELYDVPELLQTYLKLASGPVYPGSPLIAARLLRPQDRLVAIERHKEDFVELGRTLNDFARARVIEADGYERLSALLPPPERRGLILIDPPFETPDEFELVARAFTTAYRRFATGHYLLWFPVKSVAEVSSFCGEVLASGAAKVLRIDVLKHGVVDGKLSTAGLIVVNPPWQFEDEMRTVLALALPPIGAEAQFDWLVHES